MGRAAGVGLALLTIGLMAGLVVIGRAFRDTGLTGGPLIQVETTVADLSARPLTMPALAAGDPCPATPLSDIDVAYGGASHLSDVEGTGPVYATGSPPSLSAWGSYYRIAYFTVPELNGPVLLRGRDLRTGRPLVFVGQLATGSTMGTDIVSGDRVQQRAEVVLPAGSAPGWGNWRVTQGLPAGESGCLGVQVDGKDFSELIVVEYQPARG